MQHLELDPPRSFSFQSVIESHGWSQLLPFTVEAEGLGYAFVCPSGKPVSIDIAQDEARGTLHVTIAAPSRLGTQDRLGIEASVQRMLSFDSNLAAFYREARKEPALQHAATTGAGRFLRSGTLFEDIVKTILTTNVTWSGTKSMVTHLVEHFGRSAPRGRTAFPLPADLAKHSADTLKQTARLGYRAEAVHALADGFASGNLVEADFAGPSLDTEELRRRFLDLRGVGPYAAATLLMLAGRFDYIPVDSWALTLVSREWHNGEPVAPSDVEVRFNRWGRWKALAYWLWDWAHRTHDDKTTGV